MGNGRSNPAVSLFLARLKGLAVIRHGFLAAGENLLKVGFSPEDALAQPPNQADRAYLARLIAGAPLFRSAAAEDIEELARRAHSLAVPRGKAIAPLKGADEQIYIIESGAAALLDRDPAADRAILVALLGAGEVIGLVRAAEALCGVEVGHKSEWRALSNLTLVAIPAADFTRVMRRSEELSKQVLAALAHALRQMTLRFSAALLHPLEMRLAALLAQLGAIAAGNHWEPTANIGRIQQTQIAEMLGVSREHINRTLIMWEKSGLIFQTKGGDIVIENRKRLLQLSGARPPQNGAAIENDWLWEIEAHINLGLNAAAHDLAMEGVKRSPKDERYKYLAVLAMARMGSLREAISLVDAFKLSTDTPNEDIASIGPRLRRDLAFAAADGPDIKQLRLSAEGYEHVYRALKSTYPGVNAAATYAMGGDLALARKLAKEVSAAAAAALLDVDEDEPSYWARATLGECNLIAGDRAMAAANFAGALGAVDAAPGRIATTRNQLRRLKGPLGLDDLWIDAALPQGRILFFCGPLTTAGNDSQGALGRLKSRFTTFIAHHDIIAAVGALAAGADIAMAEALLEAGVPLHAHLPLPPTTFLAASVAPSAGDWRERFIACIERAQTIDWLRRVPRSRASYRLGARVAIGRAVSLADQLATAPLGCFAGQRARTVENSISLENAAIWRALGLEAQIIDDDWTASPSAAKPDTGEDYHAALIVEGANAAAINDAAKAAPLFTIAAGGLAILAFERPSGATQAALALGRSTLAGSLRIWLDVGVGGRDEKSGAAFAATLVTASCRPETVRGKIFASEVFVHAATATPDERPRFEYVGFAPTEEKLDPCPLYLLGA